jgi:hypothetical protein
MGPIDSKPTRVALDRPLREVDAKSFQGRFLVSEPRSGSGLVLAFMSVSGATTDGLAASVRDAAHASAES